SACAATTMAGRWRKARSSGATLPAVTSVTGSASISPERRAKRAEAVLFHIAGGGPSGLYLAYLLKRSNGARTVRVFEQNPPDVTFGFGVVLSGRALQFLAEGSSEAIERLTSRMERWSNQHIVHRGERVVIDGSSYAAIERLTLLRELHQLCAAAGVELRFEHRAACAADLADCD